MPFALLPEPCWCERRQASPNLHRPSRKFRHTSACTWEPAEAALDAADGAFELRGFACVLPSAWGFLSPRALCARPPRLLPLPPFCPFPRPLAFPPPCPASCPTSVARNPFPPLCGRKPPDAAAGPLWPPAAACSRGHWLPRLHRPAWKFRHTSFAADMPAWVRCVCGSVCSLSLLMAFVCLPLWSCVACVFFFFSFFSAFVPCCSFLQRRLLVVVFY